MSGLGVMMVMGAISHAPTIVPLKPRPLRPVDVKIASHVMASIPRIVVAPSDACVETAVEPPEHKFDGAGQASLSTSAASKVA
jgi:hypothetical protein